MKKEDQNKLEVSEEERKELSHLRAQKRYERLFEYGCIIESEYKRHNNKVLTVLWNQHINAYCSLDQKYIQLWRPQNCKTICSANFFQTAKSHQISCVAYIRKYQFYVVMTADFKILIYSDQLILMKNQHITLRQVNHLYYSEKHDILITAGIQGALINELKVITDYSPKQMMKLDPTGKKMKIQLNTLMMYQKSPKWVRGMKVDKEDKNILLWNNTELAICEVASGKNLYYFDNLERNDEQITEVLLYEELRYFLCGTNYGPIHLYFLSRKKHLHTFQTHSKQVTTLMKKKNTKSIFFSASKDCHICVWSLENFVKLYDFSIQEGASHCFLLSQSTFAAFYENVIKVGVFNLKGRSFANLGGGNIKVVQIEFLRDYEQNRPEYVASLADDNSLLIHDCMTGKRFSTIYPPPAATSIRKFLYSSKLKRVFLLLLSGALCVYKITPETSKLEMVVEQRDLRDLDGKPLPNQIPTTAELIQSTPPCFDSDIHGTASKAPLLTAQTEFMLIGLNKGACIFLTLDNLKQVYARVTFHRREILSAIELPHLRKLPVLKIEQHSESIQERRSSIQSHTSPQKSQATIHTKKSTETAEKESHEISRITYEKSQSVVPQVEYIFISRCAEERMCIWGFLSSVYSPSASADILQLYQVLYLSEIGNRMCPLGNSGSLMYSYHNGETDLLMWDGQNKRFLQPNTKKVSEHQGEVISISTYKGAYYVTTGSDGWLRVWNSDKELCSELHFPDPVHCACLMSDAGDVLVSHGAGGYTIIKGSEYNFQLFQGKGFTVEDYDIFSPKKKVKDLSPFPLQQILRAKKQENIDDITSNLNLRLASPIVSVTGPSRAYRKIKKKEVVPLKKRALYGGEEENENEKQKAQRRELIFGKQKYIPPRSQAPYLVNTLPKKYEMQFHNRPVTSNLPAFNPNLTRNSFTKERVPTASYFTRQELTAERIAQNIKIYNNAQGPTAPHYFPLNPGLAVMNKKLELRERTAPSMRASLNQYPARKYMNSSPLDRVSPRSGNTSVGPLQTGSSSTSKGARLLPDIKSDHKKP